MKKPAYGLNDAPRRWWNVVDKGLAELGGIPTRADRCCYVFHSSHHNPSKETVSRERSGTVPNTIELLDQAMEHLLDPVNGSISKNKTVIGAICLHVDDLFMTGNQEFVDTVVKKIGQKFKVGSEDKDDILFVGQRIRWIKGAEGTYVRVDQDRCIDELEEMLIEKHLKDDTPCTATQHTAYRSVLGMINWLQSRTQYQAAYRFSRCAACAAKPTIGDAKVLNKLVRSIKAEPSELRFWPLKGKLRILGYPDASYRNNEDKSSQRGQVIFLAEDRTSSANTRGSLVDYESQKIKRTTLSTTVAELYSLMKCYGTCQMLRGLWADISGVSVSVHLRTDANNLITTAQSTHLPEQKETIHMIQMLRKEALSGQLYDLAHVRTHACLSDCLTKASARPDALLGSVSTGNLEEADQHPSVRTLVKHRAFLQQYCFTYLSSAHLGCTFLGSTL
jgi:hypothetical protein